jgi:hypothetical protein
MTVEKGNKYILRMLGTKMMITETEKSSGRARGNSFSSVKKRFTQVKSKRTTTTNLHKKVIVYSLVVQTKFL